NIQRDREIAKRANEAIIAMGNAATAQLQAEGEDITSTVDDNVIKSVSEEIAYLGVWAGLMEVEQEKLVFGEELIAYLADNEEKLKFGEELEKFLDSNTDTISQKIGNAFLNAINSSSEPNITINTPSAFTWTNEYDSGPEMSFYVSRPLNMPWLGEIYSHNFIVTSAKYIGDPNATVISFGHNDSGNLGMVDYCTKNETSSTTHAADVQAWLALSDENSNEAKEIDYAIIPANSDDVRKIAFSVMEDNDYAMFSGVYGINSNSAAHAIANYYTNISDPSLRFAKGTDNADKIKFGYYVRENGCGSGLYYDQDLDSSPAF
ncbi:hypothetical protein KJ918_07165, partial [Patescibacteria group bacterium]|nr:hypothetical protein [Patescibacteria group bacterium]